MPKIVNGAVAARVVGHEAVNFSHETNRQRHSSDSLARVVGHEAVNFSHETNRQRHSSDSLKIMSCITDSQ